jgi:cytochrome c oxidase cbb3-type subunit 2
VNRAPLIFLTALVAFALSFGAFVLAPQIQIGRQTITKVTGGSEDYPKARAGQAAQGAIVYRANGCAACHSQTVRQGGIRIELWLKEAGTNTAQVIAAAKKLNEKFDATCLGNLPQLIVSGLEIPRKAEEAQMLFDKLGAVADVHFVPTGVDIERGWGLRHSVAADYLFDSPVLLGSQRTGPDLANIAARSPGADWQLLHLYNPRSVVTNSVMPQYKFLFTTRKIVFAPTSDALKLPEKFAAPAGYEVVPTDDARALVAYLQSLRATAPLFEAPMAAAAK